MRTPENGSKKGSKKGVCNEDFVTSKKLVRNYILFDFSMFHDDDYILLMERCPRAIEFLMRCAEHCYRNAQSEGVLISPSGKPIEAGEMFRLSGRMAEKPEWQDFFDASVEFFVMDRVEIDGAEYYRLRDWTKWWRYASDMPDNVRDRVARYRQRKSVVQGRDMRFVIEQNSMAKNGTERA